MSIKGPKGKFVLQPDDDRMHVFISSGTGIAPFISMMATLLIDGRPRRAIVLHGVRTSTTWATASWSRAGARRGRTRSSYIPTVSRPSDAAQRRLDRAGPAASRRSCLTSTTSLA